MTVKRRLLVILFLLLIGITAAVLIWSAYDSKQQQAPQTVDPPSQAAAPATLLKDAAVQTLYICPMHPHIHSDHESSCPICGMDLVAKQQTPAASEQSQATVLPQKSSYICPMHPHIMSDHEGSCPICGMDLVEQEPVTQPSASNQQADSQSRPEISITAQTIQTMGVRIKPVERSRFGSEIRSFGLVTENKRLTQVVSSRVSGWVDTLAVTAIGDQIGKRSRLLSLYSPDLIAAQQDYLSALRSGISGRTQSSRKRLQSLGLGRKALQQITTTRKAIDTVPYYSKSAGIVSRLNVSVGSYVTPGMMILHLQNYDSVWVVVSVAEKDLQFITKKTTATVMFPNLGELRRTAKVDYIYPTIDTQTRTGQVRLVLDNRDAQLKPGAYADVIFETQGQLRLSVPAQALLQSSSGSYVVKALGEGRFQPVKVVTGITHHDQVEVLEGIDLSNRIVISGQFLIDSESSLREAFTKMQQSSAEKSKPATDPHAGHDHKNHQNDHKGHQ